MEKAQLICIIYKKSFMGSAIGMITLLGLAIFMTDCGGGGGGGNSPKFPRTDLTNVSGAVNVPARFQIESDTKDPNNLPVLGSNNNDPQPISNMTVVMGYADQNDDQEDRFTLHLNDGESVMLDVCNLSTPFTCESAVADLDLYLYSGVTVVDSSENPAKTSEKVMAPADGDYEVLVNADTAAASYTLSTSSGSLATSSSNYSVNDDFLIGEALVKFKTPAPLSMSSKGVGATSEKVQNTAAQLGVTVRNMGRNGNARIDLGLDFNNSSGLKSAGFSSNAAGGIDIKQAKIKTLNKISELEKHPDIEWAEPNFIVRKAAISYDDTFYDVQWMIDSLNLENAWSGSTIQGSTVTGELTGNGVIVAVLDTGVVIGSGSSDESVDPHPDIINNILKDGATVVGYDFVSFDDIDSVPGIDPNPDDPGDNPLGGSSFHGTHVAGIVAAESNNNIGIAGVAGGAKIMPVRVLGLDGDGGYYDVAQGILWAAGLETDYGVSVPPAKIGGTNVRADVINLSLGGLSYSKTLQDATDAAQEAGVIIVAAAGNDSTNAKFYPAANPGVVGVSATDQFNNFVTSYSNYGTYIDLAAPGGDTSQAYGSTAGWGGIVSLWADDSAGDTILVGDDYLAWYQGTSMASPHVAGVAALMIEAYNKVGATEPFTPDDFNQLIKGTYDGDTTDRITSISDKKKGVRDNLYGYGIIDAKKAVDNAIAFANLPRLRFSEPSLDFGYHSDELNVELQNGGPGSADELGVVSIEDIQMPSWMSGYTVDYVSDELTIYVDRTGIGSGSYAQYSNDVQVHSSLGSNQDISISLLVGSTVATDVGTVYVLFINTSSGKLYQVLTSYIQNYQYNISLPGGTYLVYAGTDVDSDNFVNDYGEVYGELNANMTFGYGQTIPGTDIDLQLINGN
jgi:serine protease